MEGYLNFLAMLIWLGGAGYFYFRTCEFVFWLVT